MVLRVGISSGIYYAARDIELHNAIRKLGYMITRGTATMELALDVAHEVTFTQGREIRHIARKQGVIVNAHGDLTVPFEMPERGEWRDAHDRVKKSLRSAVFMGSKYIDFHSCLNIWLELITYAGRKNLQAICDSEGNFVSKLLADNKETREWFIKKRGDFYMSQILDRDENISINTEYQGSLDVLRKNLTTSIIREYLEPLKDTIVSFNRKKTLDRLAKNSREVAELLKNPDALSDPNMPIGRRLALQRAQELIDSVEIDADEEIENQIEQALLRGSPRKVGNTAIDVALDKAYAKVREQTAQQSAETRDAIVDKYMEEKFTSKDKKKQQWYQEELHPVGGIVDGYHIMAQYLYWTQDPVWVAMVDEYKDVLKKYGYKTGQKDWLDDAWRKAEADNDRDYKEFFYAAVAAKYLEGHLKKAFEWLHHDFIDEIPSWTDDPEEQHELIATAKNMIIGLENPDAREPSHAGLYPLSRVRQIFAAVKTIRSTLHTDKVMMIIDHEHIATQGQDALRELHEDVKRHPDLGSLCIASHANHPNALHTHYLIELGDVVLYELLYLMRISGFGQHQEAFLVFERGGAQDPFVRSVDALRLMAEYLHKDPPVPVKELPMEFFGMKGLTGGDIIRQQQIIRDHAYEPLKDLIEIPEEEWTLLSQSAIKKNKRPEQWKKAEFR